MLTCLLKPFHRTSHAGYSIFVFVLLISGCGSSNQRPVAPPTDPNAGNDSTFLADPDFTNDGYHIPRGTDGLPQNAFSNINSGYEPLEEGDFFDDFSGNKIDTAIWYLGDRQWGGDNGGVRPELVKVKDGIAILEAHGDLYNGPFYGEHKTQGPQKERVGAALVSRDFFGSGRFEIRAMVMPEFGATSTFWTFYYEEMPSDHHEFQRFLDLGNVVRNQPGLEYLQGGLILNHEIDIEIPGRPRGIKDPFDHISFDLALTNTWIGELPPEETSQTGELSQDVRGDYHIYRWDWYAGEKKDRSDAKVEFYIDGKLFKTITTNVPFVKGQFWAGVWFPNNWAGEPEFEIDYLLIDWVKIKPFNQSNDELRNTDSGHLQ